MKNSGITLSYLKCATPHGTFQPVKEIWNQKVTEVINYLLLSPGKHLRPMLVDWIKDFFTYTQKDDEWIDNLINNIELIHTCSLIIDDIEDSAKLRRGKPCTHIVYGIPVSLNAATFGYFFAESELRQIHPDISITETLLYGHLGQSIDLGLYDETIFRSLIEKSRDDIMTLYEELVYCKTGILFAFALGAFEKKLGSLKEDFHQNIKETLLHFGRVYQTLDDIMTFSQKESHKYLEDLDNPLKNYVFLSFFTEQSKQLRTQLFQCWKEDRLSLEKLISMGFSGHIEKTLSEAKAELNFCHDRFLTLSKTDKQFQIVQKLFELSTKHASLNRTENEKI